MAIMVGLRLLTDINTVVIPVAPGHILIDFGIDASHSCDGGARCRALDSRRGGADDSVDGADWWCQREGAQGQQRQ